MTMNSMTITLPPLFEFFPFQKLILTLAKPLPDLRAVEGEKSRILPEINNWCPVFITDQTETTMELLMIRNGRRRIMMGIYDVSIVEHYLKPLALESSDITHMERVCLTLDEMLQQLDKARDYQDSADDLRKLVNTMDYVQHYPIEAYDETKPHYVSERLECVLRLSSGGLIEIVMNEADETQTERIIQDIVLNNNRYRGKWVTGHYRKSITKTTSIDELIELFSQDFKERLPEHLLILELEVDPEVVYWKSFLNTQLVPYLDEIIKECVVVLINHSQDSLLFDDLPMYIFYFDNRLS